MMLRKILRWKKKYEETGGSSVILTAMICTPRQMLFGVKSSRARWAGHVTSVGRWKM